MPNPNLPDSTVHLLRKALRAQDISTARAAHTLGTSRAHLSQMLNGKRPMRRVYGLALRQLIADVVAKRSESVDHLTNH